uniref:Uncharacterized protein n=1 Tax=Pantoea phage Survivor TaxID=3232176 RepID=A0AAU8KZE4_9CAUD
MLKREERRLFMLKYGYIGPGENLSSYLVYNEQLNDYYHPLSGKAFGETFGLREYNKWLPLKDYLEMPVDTIDDILEGVARGQEKLAKLKAEAAKRAAQQSGQSNDPQTAAIRNAMKEK